MIAIDPLADFLERQLRAWPEPAPTASSVVRTLLAAAFYGDGGEVRRRPVVDSGGTPVLLSFQENGGEGAPPFRVLVEPGLASLRVCEQVDLTLETVNALFAILQWQGCAPVLNAIMRTILPHDAATTDAWWGGLGLGLSLDVRGLELRIYCNVREGSIASRWERIRALFMLFGVSPTNDAPLREFLARASRWAIPAGIALCLCDGSVRGLRVYLCLPEPSVNALCELGEAEYARRDFAAIFAAYTDVREVTYGCVTVAYDFFVAPDRTIALRAERFKADFDCTPDPRARCAQASAMADWLSARHEALGLSAHRLRAFLDDLQRSCGQYTIDYVSFGLRRGSYEITTYALPGGYATLRNA